MDSNGFLAWPRKGRGIYSDSLHFLHNLFPDLLTCSTKQTYFKQFTSPLLCAQIHRVCNKKFTCIYTQCLLFPAVSSFKRQTPCHKVGRNLFGASSWKSNLIRLKAKGIPWLETLSFSSVQFSRSVVSDSCDPMDLSTPGLPVHHQCPDFTQTHVHSVGDAIQPSHPLSFPYLPAFSISQNQGAFKWVRSSHQVAKVLEFQLQHHSFQWTPRTDLLQDGLVGSPCSPRDSQESSPTPQLKSIISSVLSSLYSPTLVSIHDCWINQSLD